MQTLFKKEGEMMIRVLMVVLLAFTLTACGGSKKSGSGNSGGGDTGGGDDNGVLPMVLLDANDSYSTNCGYLAEYYSGYFNPYTGTYDKFYVSPIKWLRVIVSDVKDDIATVTFTKQLWAPNWSTDRANYTLHTTLMQYYIANGYENFTMSNTVATNLTYASCRGVDFHDWFTYYSGSSEFYTTTVEYKGNTGVINQNGSQLTGKRFVLNNISGQRDFFDSLRQRSGMFANRYVNNNDIISYDLVSINGAFYVMLTKNGYRYVETTFPLFED